MRHQHYGTKQRARTNHSPENLRPLLMKSSSILYSDECRLFFYHVQCTMYIQHLLFRFATVCPYWALVFLSDVIFVRIDLLCQWETFFFSLCKMENFVLFFSLWSTSVEFSDFVISFGAYLDRYSYICGIFVCCWHISVGNFWGKKSPANSWLRLAEKDLP